MSKKQDSTVSTALRTRGPKQSSLAARSLSTPTLVGALMTRSLELSQVVGLIGRYKGGFVVNTSRPMTFEGYLAQRPSVPQPRVMRAVIWSPGEPPTYLAWLELAWNIGEANDWAAQCAEMVKGRCTKERRRWLQPMTFGEYCKHRAAHPTEANPQLEAMSAMVWDPSVPPCFNAWMVLHSGIAKALEVAARARLNAALVV